jgi:N-acetylglucosaminyldiphosphoundecaprenol N-acetyl-beta-D-mannosaminyltransferase
VARHHGSLRILGIRVDDVTMEETLTLFASWIEEGTPHQVVTVNPEFVMAAQQDTTFRVTLDEADVAVPDGAGLLWASRVLRKPLRERVAGSDLVPRLAELSARHGYRLYLLGAAPGVAERTAGVLASQQPKASIVGTYAGSPAADEEDAIVARVRAASPDILLVAYGAPKQDLWIRRNLRRLAVPVCMGVGGAFDFVAGVTRRAPVWMRRTGLEWLHRLIHEPWRWRRMLALPRFAWCVFRSARGRDT